MLIMVVRPHLVWLWLTAMATISGRSDGNHDRRQCQKAATAAKGNNHKGVAMVVHDHKRQSQWGMPNAIFDRHYWAMVGYVYGNNYGGNWLLR